MLKSASLRQGRPRARSGANRRPTPSSETPILVTAETIPADVNGRRQRLARPRPDLDALLGRFSDALAFVETASHALDAVEEKGPSIRFGPELATLRHGLRAVRRVYRELDLAIMALDEGQTPA